MKMLPAQFKARRDISCPDKGNAFAAELSLPVRGGDEITLNAPNAARCSYLAPGTGILNLISLS